MDLVLFFKKIRIGNHICHVSGEEEKEKVHKYTLKSVSVVVMSLPQLGMFAFAVCP
jgi:heterodisulfide reductase subunit B